MYIFTTVIKLKQIQDLLLYDVACIYVQTCSHSLRLAAHTKNVCYCSSITEVMFSSFSIIHLSAKYFIKISTQTNVNGEKRSSNIMFRIYTYINTYST